MSDDLKTILLNKMLKDACGRGDLDEVIQCIDNGAKQKHHYEPLNEAVMNGHLNIVQYLYEKYELNQKNSTYSLSLGLKQKLLDTSLYYGHLNIAKFFILSDPDEYNFTRSFQESCTTGHLHIFSYLLETYPFLHININRFYMKELFNHNHENIMDYLVEKNQITSFLKNEEYQDFFILAQQRVNLKKLNEVLNTDLDEKETQKRNKI